MTEQTEAGVTQALKECPFCGSLEVFVAGVPANVVKPAAACMDCGALGPRAQTREHEAGSKQAIAAWNTRSTLLPATEPTCDLCVGKCRGHSLGGNRAAWEPEPGSREDLRRKAATDAQGLVMRLHEAPVDRALCYEAAARITALEAALAPFAKAADEAERLAGHDGPLDPMVSLQDCYHARIALRAQGARNGG